MCLNSYLISVTASQSCIYKYIYCIYCTFTGLNSNENRCFHLADIFGRSILLHTAGQHLLWLCLHNSLLHDITMDLQKVEWNILHSPPLPSKVTVTGACSAHRLYIITRALPIITIGISNFILRGS